MLESIVLFIFRFYFYISCLSFLLTLDHITKLYYITPFSLDKLPYV